MTFSSSVNWRQSFKKAEIFPLSVVGKHVAFLKSLSSSLWAVPLSQAVITECIVMIRKSVLRLECDRKLVYVMNTLSHLFPVLGADYCMWGSL